MTADASDVLPCCGGSGGIKIQRSGQRRHGPADTPVETDFEAQWNSPRGPARNHRLCTERRKVCILSARFAITQLRVTYRVTKPAEIGRQTV